MRRVLALSVAAFGVIAVAAGIAAAHDAVFETKKVAIKHETPESFTGKVRAGGGCKVDRTVKVTKVEEYGGGGDPLGTAKTDETGAWTLNMPSAVSPGGYKAVAKKTSVEHGDDLHKCKKGTSKVLTVN
ncbi:MAG TPA: hypothetical protein VEK39_00490 [Solirubrobacterales bacterium]|nr:hypothetical protein [Solirubrobacterales bacterium]